jgi:proteasome lid subunit RPN8/RPN11
MKCFLKHRAWQKMQYYIQNIDAEISGWGKTEVVNGDIYVLDLVIFKQSVTSGSTDLDEDARAKFGMELKRRGEKQENWNLWWHSHANMKTFWSSIDEKAIENEIGRIPYLLSIVSNKAGDILTRIDVTMTDNSPFGIGYEQKTVDNVETEIEPVLVGKEEMVQYNLLSGESRSLNEELEQINTLFVGKKKELDDKNKEIEDLISKFEQDDELETACIKEIKDKVTEKTDWKKDYKWTGKDNGYKYQAGIDDYDDAYYDKFLNTKRLPAGKTSLDKYVEENYESQSQYLDNEELISNDDMKFKIDVVRDISLADVK